MTQRKTENKSRQAPKARRNRKPKNGLDLIKSAIARIQSGDELLKSTAIAYLTKWMEKAGNELDKTRILHQLGHEVTFEILEEYHRSCIEKKTAEERLKLALQRVEVMQEQVKDTVKAFEDSNLDDDTNWSLDLIHLALVKQDEQPQKELLKFCKELLAEGNQSLFREIHEGTLPEEITEIAKANGNWIPVFLSDLTSFITDFGDDGMALARLCFTDPEEAHLQANEHGDAKPILFLATLVLRHGMEDDHVN